MAKKRVKKSRVINANKFFPLTMDDLYSTIATHENPKFGKDGRGRLKLKRRKK